MDKPGAFFFNFIRNIFSRKPPVTKEPQTPVTPLPTEPPPKVEDKWGRPVDYIGTTYAEDNSTMLSQLREAQRYYDIIESAAHRYHFQSAVICGIGSRESHWGLGLTPPGPAGRGDFAQRKPRGQRFTDIPPDGPGYGRGIMQIDYDWHEFARIGQWQSPKENVLYACEVLDKARKFFQKRTNLRGEQLLRATIAAYNAGATATLGAINQGLDVDAKTTGRDYSRDVMNRAGWFQLHGWE